MSRIYPYGVLIFLILNLCTTSGCSKLSWLNFRKTPEKIVPKYITYTVPKWQPMGVVSEESPTVIRVLKKYTGSMSAANSIIKANNWKYDQVFYQNLPFGIPIYIAEDGELLIDPKGTEIPDEVIIKRKSNPEYLTIKVKSSRGSHSQEYEMSSSIEEEDLSQYAGKEIKLELVNKASDWAWEAGYWAKIEILTE